MRLSVLLLAFTIGLTGISLTACNTVQGAGRDLESIGKAGEEALD